MNRFNGQQPDAGEEARYPDELRVHGRVQVRRVVQRRSTTLEFFS